jgi:hypothetical protein
MTGKRRGSFAAIAAIAAAVSLLVAMLAGVPPATAAVLPRIDLRVLVLSDGSPSVEAIETQLRREGVPTTVVALSGSHDLARPGALFDEVSEGGSTIPRAKFQAVVLPRSLASIPQLSADERAAINELQSAFSVRGVIAYDWANPAVGLSWSKFVGSLDGASASVTVSAKQGGFGYLKGALPFDDFSPEVQESYAYVADPDVSASATGTFTPYVTVAAPNGQVGSIAGVHRVGTVENLVLTFAANGEQLQFRLLGPGIVTWMTRGIHLGMERSFLSVHVDDVFLPDSRWDIAGNCTPEEDCPAGVTTPAIRMTTEDVSAVRQWQKSVRAKYPTAKSVVLDMVFNGAGAEEAKEANGGTDAMSAAMLAAKSEFRWINHTWSHEYLGCVQDFSTIPWRCAEDGQGAVLWKPKEVLVDEIKRNKDWAALNGLTKLGGAKYNAEALVTGEHSGLRREPIEPSDNPWLDDALNDLRMGVVASDASREAGTRKVGRAGTVPRYPVAVYFNTGTEAEMADEYNWIYGSRAQGGSGYCEDHPETTTCLARPLDLGSGFRSYIVPWQTRQSMSWILGNDVRPYYAHQSNLAEERTLLTLLDAVLDEYDRLIAANRPLVVPTMQQALAELNRQNSWNAQLAGGKVSAYLIGDTVTVVNSATGRRSLPMTLPAGSVSSAGAAFGAAYSGQSSGTVSVLASSATSWQVPGASAWPAQAAAEAEPAPPAPASPLRTPGEVDETPVLLTPERVAAG